VATATTWERNKRGLIDQGPVMGELRTTARYEAFIPAIYRRVSLQELLKRAEKSRLSDEVYCFAKVGWQASTGRIPPSGFLAASDRKLELEKLTPVNCFL
jgi:hypothetical protein